MNQVVHNTIWVTGHFHLTAATSVVLTFFGISYWLVPHLTGRKLTKAMNKLGIIQGWVWLIGMTFMSGAMHLPRATRRAKTFFFLYIWRIAQALNGFHIKSLKQLVERFYSLELFWSLSSSLILLSLHQKGKRNSLLREAENPEETAPMVFENWKLWLGIAVLLILFAYTIPFIDMIQNAPPGSKGYKTW